MEKVDTFAQDRLAFVQRHIPAIEISKDEFIALIASQNNKFLERTVEQFILSKEKRATLKKEQKNIVLSIIYNAIYRKEYNRHLFNIRSQEVLRSGLHYFSDRSIADFALI